MERKKAGHRVKAHQLKSRHPRNAKKLPRVANSKFLRVNLMNNHQTEAEVITNPTKNSSPKRPQLEVFEDPIKRDVVEDQTLGLRDPKEDLRQV